MEAVLTKQELQRARLRAVRRANIQARNEPPRLTLGAEVFNAVSHGLGALGAAAALAVYGSLAFAVLEFPISGIYLLLIGFSVPCLLGGFFIRTELRRL